MIRSLAYIKEEYRNSLIESHGIKSKPIELPLAGHSELIVITHKQAVDYDRIFAAMELAVSEYERFLGLPFPFTDITFLVNDTSIWDTRSLGNFLGSNTSSYFTLN